jgi:alpha-galactosidase
MTIKAAKERKMEYVYMAVALDPHTSSEMTLDNIKAMCDELYAQHRKDGFMPEYS